MMRVIQSVIIIGHSWFQALMLNVFYTLLAYPSVFIYSANYFLESAYYVPGAYLKCWRFSSEQNSPVLCGAYILVGGQRRYTE